MAYCHSEKVQMFACAFSLNLGGAMANSAGRLVNALPNSHNTSNTNGENS